MSKQSRIIFTEIKKFQGPKKGKIHNVWYPIKNYQARKEGYSRGNQQ